MNPKPDFAVTPEIPGIAAEDGVVKDTRAKTGIPDVISAETDILATMTITPDSPVKTGRDSGNEGCYYCKGTDHRLQDCKKVTCITCGKKAHTTIDCKSEDSKKIREVLHDGPRYLHSRYQAHILMGKRSHPHTICKSDSLNKKTNRFY